MSRSDKTKNKKIKSKPQKIPDIPEPIVLRNKRGDSILPGAFLLLLAAVVLIYAVTTDNINIKLGCLIFVLPLLCFLGIVFTCFYFRWKIMINDNKIICRRTFGKTKIFKVEQINRATIARYRGIRSMVVYAEKKYMFSLFTTCFGYDDFYNLLKSRNIPIFSK